MPSFAGLPRLRYTVLLAAALIACCGSVLKGPVHGRVEFSSPDHGHDAVVFMRCSGPALHGEMTTDRESTRVATDGSYAILWSLQIPGTRRCYLNVRHPRYLTAHVVLDDAFSQRVAPLRMESWDAFLDRGPDYQGLNSRTHRPWPESELHRHLYDTEMWLRHFSVSEQHEFSHYVPVIHEIFRRALRAGPLTWPSQQLESVLDSIARIEERTGYPAPFRELLEAARSGDAQRARQLIDGGVLLEAWDRNRYTPLLAAASEGHVEVIEVLLDTGLPVTDDGCGSPLLASLSRWHWRAALFLLRAGADPTAECRNWRTVGDAMVGFARDGELELLQAFLDARVPVDIVSQQGATALAEASRIGRIDMVKALLARGADPAARSATGESILNEAVANGYLDVERALRKAGA